MENKTAYDKTSPHSIYEYSLKLFGKSLSQVVMLPEGIENTRNRGDLGSLVEKYFFEHVPDSNIGPDFPDADMELKTTGVVRTKAGDYKAKERLVLSMINFEKVAIEKWEHSSLISKCRRMLILFYLYEKEVSVSDRVFVLPPMLYEMPERDLPVIKRDWEFIQGKILAGKAHELSEGDTFYLGACRKGAGGDKEPLRTQPMSSEGAKARAFSFKQNYLNYLIQGQSSDSNLLNSPNEESIENATQLRFRPFEGMSIAELSEKLNYWKRDKNHKGFHRELANRILKGKMDSIPELKKAGIEMKTIRLKRNGIPRESMSFPGFNFLEILNQEWEDSVFFEKIESKFLFVVFQEDALGIERLLCARYWNMPYGDRLEAQRVWEETKRRVAVDATNLPSARESKVAHVRPKGRDGKDKALTPQGNLHLKQCFWLNSSYIGEALRNI